MLAVCREQLSKSVGLRGRLVFIWWGWIPVTLLCSSPGSPEHLATDLVSQCWSLVFCFGAVIQARAAPGVVHVPAAPPSPGYLLEIQNLARAPLQLLIQNLHF